MDFLKKSFSKDRPVKDFIQLALSHVMIIVSVLYLVIDAGALKIQDYSRTFSFIMMLAGAIVGILSFFLDIKILKDYLPLISLALYAMGTGRQFYLVAYPFADLLTGVNWFGGNLAIYLAFFLLFLCASILEIVLLFLPDEKKTKKE